MRDKIYPLSSFIYSKAKKLKKSNSVKSESLPTGESKYE